VKENYFILIKPFAAMNVFAMTLQHFAERHSAE
jgi:hypothetical protein